MKILIVWIICGVFSYGTLTAQWKGEFPNSNLRDSLGLRVFISSTGPIGVMASILVTNFFQYGWSIK